MMMTEREIVTDYRTAKDKKKQIKILAELNLCSAEEIRTILRSWGLRPGQEEAPKGLRSAARLAKDLQAEKKKSDLARDHKEDEKQSETVREQVMVELKDRAVKLETSTSPAFAAAVVELIGGDMFADEIELIDKEIAKLKEKKEKLLKVQEVLREYIA